MSRKHLSGTSEPDSGASAHRPGAGSGCPPTVPPDPAQQRLPRGLTANPPAPDNWTACERPGPTDPDRPDRPGPQDTETSDAGSWHRDLRPLPPPPPSSPGLPGPHDRRKTKDGRPRSNREQQAAERCRNQRKLQGHGSNQRVDRSPPSQRPPECRPPCPG